jgi:multidrug efflux pump subunit AcrA (membrane-fusion protein)
VVPVVTTAPVAPDAPPPPPRTRTVTVRAGSTGTVASLPVLVDQEVSVGSDLATVSPGSLSVSAPLTQAQQFRLLKPPGSASAQAPGGPAPFDCTDLRTEAAAAAAEPVAPDPYSGMPPQATTAQLHCRVPAGTTVFAGMSVTVTVRTGEADGALLVPVTAVLGTVDTGTVWLPGEDGAPEERPVRLGITDGVQVQVLEGLAEGDEVLEFTPVPADEPPAEGLPVGGPDGVVYG